MAKKSNSTVRVGIWRADQDAAYNTPRAWKAHRLRANVFERATKRKSLRVVNTGDLYDEKSTHEFAEAVIEILNAPTTKVVLAAGGVYVLKHLAKPLDDWIEAGVKRLYKSLAEVAGMKQIDGFVITLPSGEQIQVAPDARVTVNGKEIGREESKAAGKKPKARTRRR